MSALILNSKVKQQLDSGYFEIFQTIDSEDLPEFTKVNMAQ